jgi:thioredoxin 2
VTDALIIVCPRCGTLNRVPKSRLGDRPNCGSCKAALLPGAPIEPDPALLDKLLSRDQLPLLLDLWAPWCGPCRSFAPIFAEAASRLPKVRFAKLNTEAHPDAAASFAVRAIPTLIGFRGGQEVARRSGAMPLSDLLRLAQSLGA